MRDRKDREGRRAPDGVDAALERAIDELELRRAARSGAGSVLGLPEGGAAAATTAAERAAFLERYPFERFQADLERRQQRSAAAEAAFDEGRAPTSGGVWARLRAAFGRVVSDRRLAAAVGVAGVVLVAGALWFAGPFGSGGGAGGGAGGGSGGGSGEGLGTDAPVAPELRGFPVRPKGGPEAPVTKSDSPTVAGEDVGVSFFVRNGHGAVPGMPGSAYREGDQFRFTYWSGRNDYLLLLSMEEDGTVSVYYPDEAATGAGGESVAIARGRNVPLEGSVVLNDYVGRERFFALFSTRPLSLVEVRAAAVQAVSELRSEGRDLRSLERLPIDVPQASFWIDKVASPAASPGERGGR